MSDDARGLSAAAIASDTKPQEPLGTFARVLIGSGFTAVLVTLTAFRAAAKPFWFDELFTLYISRLPNWTQVAAALRDRADLNPPELYALTRMVQSVFGDGHVATRLPQNVGFAVMCICLYLFVSKRLGNSYGAVAACLPLVTGAYRYAYEARTYGVTLGLAAVSLLAWQAASSGRKRPVTVPAMALVFTAATLSHYYAVLLIVPLACGEAVRACRRKRIDWLLVAAMLGPAVAVGCYSLSSADKIVVLDTLAFPQPLTFVIFLFEPALWALLIAFIVAFSVQRVPAPRPSGIPPHELAAAFGFLAIPALVAAQGLFTGVYHDRYGLPAVIGVAVAAAAFLHRAVRGSEVPAFMFAGVLGIWFFFTGVQAALNPVRAESAAIPKVLLDTASRSPDTPIVAASPFDFLKFDHYGTRSFVRQLVFVYADDDSAQRYTAGTPEIRPTIRKWFPIRAGIEQYGSFVRAHQRFLLVGDPDLEFCWLFKRLADEKAAMRFLDRDRGRWLVLEVSLPLRQPRER